MLVMSFNIVLSTQCIADHINESSKFISLLKSFNRLFFLFFLLFFKVAFYDKFYIQICKEDFIESFIICNAI